MLGKRQFGWLKDSLAGSKATWKMLANQVILAEIDTKERPERQFPMDDWCGYVHERNELMNITSGGNGGEHKERGKALMAENPGVRFFNNERGYVRCTITPKTWRSEFRTMAEITKPGAPAVTQATFVVEAGKPGAKQA